MSRLCGEGNFYRNKLNTCLNLLPEITSARHIFVKEYLPHAVTAFGSLDFIVVFIYFYHKRFSAKPFEIWHNLCEFIFELTRDWIKFYIEYIRHFSCHNIGRFYPSNINDFLVVFFFFSCLLIFIALIIIPHYVNNCKFFT